MAGKKKVLKMGKATKKTLKKKMQAKVAKTKKPKPKLKAKPAKKKILKKQKMPKPVSETAEEEITLSPKEMKRQREEILKDDALREYLIQNCGECAIDVILNLLEPMTDEKLARKLDKKTTLIRAALNKLYMMKITNYSREKDPETNEKNYFWVVRHEDLMKLAEEIKMKSALKEAETGEGEDVMYS